MVCPKCKSPRIHRVKREGFVRVKLAPLFGYFPWECAACGKKQLLRTRGKRSSSHHKSHGREEALGSPVGHSR